MARAILFDLDGVLVHSYEAWFALMNATARGLGFPVISRERFHASFGQSTADDARDFFPGRTEAEVSAYFVAHFRDHAAHMKIDPDAAPIVARLRAGGVRTAIVTNSPRPLALQILAAARIEADALVGGTDVPSPKPAPDMVFRALRELDVAPADALMVGDSRFDREAAGAAGVPFVGFGGLEGDLAIADLRAILPLAGLEPA